MGIVDKSKVFIEKISGQKLLRADTERILAHGQKFWVGHNLVSSTSMPQLSGGTLL